MFQRLAHSLALLVPVSLGWAAQEPAPKKQEPTRSAQAPDRAVRYSTAAGQAAFDADSELEKAAAALEKAKTKAAVTDLKKAAESLTALVKEKATPWRRHFLALAHYDFATLIEDEKPEEAAAQRELAITELQKALSEDSKLDEARAFLAICLAQKIDPSDPQSMMALAIDAENHFQKALGSSPQNPIVLVQFGVFKHFTPAEYGGGPSVSRPYFERALARDPAYLEGQAWMAICLKDAGDKEAAKKIVDRLEKDHQDNAWIQGLLRNLYHEIF